MKISFFSGSQVEELLNLPAVMRGEPGPQGPVGPVGPAGSAGQSAYQLALAAGFVGTEGQWLASLKGTKGDTGATGSMGATGPQGLTVKGNWLSSFTYAKDDVVRVGGALYIARLAVPSGQPAPNAGNGNWFMILADGAAGDTGSQGPAGNAGPAGASATFTYFTDRTAYNAYVPGPLELKIYTGAA